MTDIAIIGTGQIGTSIALRLQETGAGRKYRVIGVDRMRDHAVAARRTGAFVDVIADPARAVRDAGLVVLATPTGAIIRLLHDLAGDIPEGATVTDVGSTKARIQRAAQEALPAGVAFVGGHPMAGTTGTGPAAADPALFSGARWVVTPAGGTPEPAVDLVLGLVALMGARAMLMDAEEHDAYVAAISHLPLISSTALFHLARSSEAWPELSTLAAGGFRSATRLAGTDEHMAHDIASTNRDQLVHWLDRYRAELGRVRALLADADADEDLFRYLAEASIQHGAFEAGAIGRTEVDERIETPDLSLFDFVMGGALAQRARELAQEPEPTDRRGRRDR